MLVRTLWGELAWQLGGPEGYALIAEADQTATNPWGWPRGPVPARRPCLVLIAYARQLQP